MALNTISNFLNSTIAISHPDGLTAQFVLMFSTGLSVLAFFTGMFFLRSKHRIYFYFFTLLIFSIMGALLYAGNLIEFNPVNHLFGNLASQFFKFFTLGAFGFFCFFALRLLEVKKKNRFLYLWMLSGGIFSIFSGFCYLFFQTETIENSRFYFLFPKLIILLFSFVGIAGVVLKIQSAVKKYFLLGSSFYILGTMLAVLKFVSPDSRIPGFSVLSPELYFHLGVFVGVIMFSLGLLCRIYFHYENVKSNQVKVNALAIYEKEQAEAEAFSLKIQINPHFLFNYLNVLKYYIQINENKKAIDYLVKFGKLVRGITDSSDQKIISLSQELKMTEQYLDLEKIRYEDEFNYQIETDSSVRLNEIMIPPMLLQPFIEEILWTSRQNEHARPQKIDIGVKKSENGVLVTVLGAESSNEVKFQRDINKEINRKRIELFNKYYKSKISVSQTDEGAENNRNKQPEVIIKIDTFQTD